MSEHTPTPWEWLIHDHSMASLGVMPDPGLGNPLVLAIGPCPSCADRAQPREWKWGRCHTPSEADAEFIVKAVNNHEALLEFFKWAMREGPFDGCDLDGASIQEKAEGLGLIVKTKYDAEKHGVQSEFEHGDDWFEYAPDIRAHLIAPLNK